ncbi:Slc9a8 [Symbiodinium sp. CCMP2592]|nr:Slc9a8 [Symbiodinium sp. CCMP2592]
MPAHPETVEEWCHLVPHLLSPAGWNSIAEAQSASVSHCTCPWGGSLVKLAVPDVEVENAPADQSCVFVRPESRAWGASTFAKTSPEYFAVREQLALAPGDAIVCRWASLKVLRLFAVLFGEMGTEFLQAHFYNPAEAAELRMCTQRNYPQAGDCSSTLTSLSEPFEAINFCRPAGVPGMFNLYHIFRVPKVIKLTNWATAQLHRTIESGRKVAQYYLNRPGICEIRAFDQQYYVVLTIQSFKRGNPMIPVYTDEDGKDDSEDVTRIDAGKSMGLTTWARYDPAEVGSDRFLLSGYMKAFANRLGESLNFYQSLDGQELLYFQCVVSREEWSRVQERLKDAYLLQKTAYRRANGGAQAPGLNEGSKPRFCKDVSLDSLEEPRLLSLFVVDCNSSSL